MSLSGVPRRRRVGCRKYPMNKGGVPTRLGRPVADRGLPRRRFGPITPFVQEKRMPKNFRFTPAFVMGASTLAIATLAQAQATTPVLVRNGAGTTIATN